MTQPAILIVIQGLETVGEKGCDHLFPWWIDSVFLSLSKEPIQGVVSLKALSSWNPSYTPNHS